MKDLDVPALEAELREAVLPALGGPADDKLFKTLRRIVDARLRRRIGPWLRGYEVSVGPDPSGEGVMIAVSLRSADEVRSIRFDSRLL